MKPNKIISDTLIKELLPRAASSSRCRINHNIHNHYSDTVQRFINVIEYDSYVRPHYHNATDAWEGFVIVKGHLGIFQFDHRGKLVSRNELHQEGPVYGLELDSTFPHSVTSLSESCIVFEYKQGPYLADNDKTFPLWAPDDGQDKQSRDYLRWLKIAEIGEQYI